MSVDESWFAEVREVEAVERRREVDAVGDEGRGETEQAASQDVGPEEARLSVKRSGISSEPETVRVVHVVFKASDGNPCRESQPDRRPHASQEPRLQWTSPSLSVPTVGVCAVPAGDPKRQVPQPSERLGRVAGGKGPAAFGYQTCRTGADVWLFEGRLAAGEKVGSEPADGGFEEGERDFRDGVGG